MSLMNWFNKPQWKNKDANIRAKAVHSDTSAELLAQLIHISQNDESEKVRSVAIKRLSDYAIIAKVAENDSHKSVKSAAYKMLQDWFSKSNTEQQLSIIKEVTDNKTIELAARDSGNKEIRKYCIEKISKQGLLGDLLIEEKDKDLRQIIVNKIDKPATLKRISKSLKNKDKHIFKIIQNKLESDIDTQKIAQKKAIDLCERMEKLIHNASSSDQKDVDHINNEWQELNKSYDLSTFEQRYKGALRTANLTFDPKQREQFLSQQRKQRIDSKIDELKKANHQSKEANWEDIQTQISKFSGFDLEHASKEQATEFTQQLDTLKTLRDQQSKQNDLPEPLLKVVDKLDTTLKQQYQQPSQISHFRKTWDAQAKKASKNTAFNTLKARFDNSMLKLAEKIEQSANLRDQAAKNAVSDISTARALIKDGQLSQAKIAINKIAENKKIAGHHTLIKEHKFEFDTLWNELKELRKWQKWSNDKARVQLIEELKALLGKGTHPDALLKKMKEANKKWKDMEDHEKLAGDKFGTRNMELYTQFREVQKALFEPAQQYFEKRSELWDKELENLESEIQTLNEVDLNETSDRDLARMVRSAINKLRNLDKIPPNKRGKCASAIRSGTARIDAHLQESYAIARRRKQKLIEQAQELSEVEDLDSAIEQAKALQQEWKNAGIVQQNQERKLWKSFRHANDAVFNRIQIQRDQTKAENQELFNQANELIKSCEQAIKSENNAENIQTHLLKFKDNMSELNIDNKKIVSKVNQLTVDAEKKILILANSENIKQLKNAQKFANICQALELQEIDKATAQKQWDNQEAITDNKLSKMLLKRFENSESDNPDFIEQASHILIASEYLTGVSSPDEYKEQRLSYQVEELSKRMSGESDISETEKAQKLLREWFVLNGTDKHFMEKNLHRCKNTVNSLFQLLAG